MKLNLNLEGKDDNVFTLLAYFRKEAKKAGWSEGEINEVIEEASSGDYNHLIRTLMSV